MSVFAPRRDVHVYVIPVAVLGSVISIYHVLVERFPNLESSVCDVSNPCTVIWTRRFGFETIPTMALTAFVLIIVVLSIGVVKPTGNWLIRRGSSRWRRHEKARKVARRNKGARPGRPKEAKRSLRCRPIRDPSAQQSSRIAAVIWGVAIQQANLGNDNRRQRLARQKTSTNGDGQWRRARRH